ncbi:putative Transferase [Desulfamplus magnetovallimortis]|uniref:Putative Transferase n=1 Tax=Desulfamplus magnetovallimortis TaxID=1246637 RepID=A0A1W1HER2_9BACT|nr:phosphocholine cytidylyltransferase family protein [Desulfamplus magnetovallimortis]SLM30916.1 putative Transferase [Desulfamplus magnetovallimortis]
MIQQALILAAGRGSRMQEATLYMPKCLISLQGKPMLHWQIDAIRANQISHITVACGYKSEMITGVFKTVHNPLWAETNMVSTMLCALPSLDNSPCLVSYSDILYHPDHIKAFQGCPYEIAVLYDTSWKSLWELRFSNPLDDAETFIEDNGQLQDIGRKTDSYDDIKGQFMGLLYFTPTGFLLVTDYVKTLSTDQISCLDMTSLLQRLLAEHIKIGAIPVSGKWCEADSRQDIMCYENEIMKHQQMDTYWLHDWR